MMEENEEDKTVYYVSKLDQHQRSGKVLHYLPLPPGIGFYFSLTSYALVAYYEVYIGSFFILPIIAIIYTIDLYYVAHLRGDVLTECMMEEIILENDIEKHPMDPEEWEPNYVTNEDRDSIFQDAINFNRISNIKYYLKFVFYFSLFAIGLFILFYFSVLAIKINL